MAINFGDTLMEGSIEPGAKVQSPVQDNSGAVLAEAFRPAAAAIGQIAGSIFKGAQDDANAKILTNYENDLLDLADSVDQGVITRNEAMIKARNLRRQYLANAPALQDDFDTVWTDFAGASGLGHVVVEGTVEQQAQEARVSEAIKLGYPSVEAYDMFLTRARELSALNQEVSILQGQGQLVTESQRNRYIQATVGVAESAYPAAQRQINEAMSAINANPNNKAEIAANLNVVLGQSIAQLEYLTGNSPDNAYITAPIKSAMDTFNKWVNGEVAQSVMEGQLKITQQSYNLMYATDPVLGPIIAQSKLINDLGLANTALGVNIWTPEAIKKLADVSTPNQTVNVVDETEGSARFMDNVKQAAGSVSDTSDPEYIQEVRMSIEQMIDSAYVHERSATGGAMSYKDLVNNLGSPEIGQFIATHGISPKYAQQAVEVLKAAYEQELLPVINREWTNTVFVDNVPVSDIVEPRWNGNAVEFVPTEAYANDINARYLATELNTGDSSMAIPLNNLINTYANITGVDAGKIYEEDFAGRLFGMGEEEEAGIADRVNEALNATSEDAFTLGDFNPDTLEPIEEYVSQDSSLQNDLPALAPTYLDSRGIDFNSYLPSIRRSESGGNDAATNPNSTATGRYQFLKSTWDELVARYPDAGLTTSGRTDPNQQEVAIRLFTAENGRYLEGQNIPLNNGTLYAAHFLGASDAAKVLKAGSGLVSDYVPAKVIRANPFLRGMTVAEFKSWANRKGNA